VPDRIANKFILAEDREQQNLVRRYMERCGHGAGLRRVPLPAKGPGGSGEKYVRDQYPVQLQACHSSIGRRASSLLIVIIDADMEETRHRATQLADSLETARRNCHPNGQYQFRPLEINEPVVVLIPKRHIETWIRALLGVQVNEHDKYKDRPPTPNEIVRTAETIFVWAREGVPPGRSAPPSLANSIPEWRKIRS
jgi:hypothetical protein